MREDLGRPAAGLAAGLGDGFVAARVIGMEVRVEHPPDRLVRELLDRGDHAVGVLRQPGIDDQHAIVADLHRDVAAGADQHVDAALHVDRFELGGIAGGRRGRRLSRDALCEAGGAEQHARGEELL